MVESLTKLFFAEGGHLRSLLPTRRTLGELTEDPALRLSEALELLATVHEEAGDALLALADQAYCEGRKVLEIRYKDTSDRFYGAARYLRQDQADLNSNAREGWRIVECLIRGDSLN